VLPWSNVERAVCLQAASRAATTGCRWAFYDFRCDNGPELTAQTLKDWCRFAGVTTSYIEPGAPWEKPYVESFNGHLRRELLDMESFNTPLEAQIPARRLAARLQPPPTPSITQLPTPAAYAHQWHAEHDHRPHNKWTNKRGHVIATDRSVDKKKEDSLWVWRSRPCP
jgi:transposase InsO family protein